MVIGGQAVLLYGEPRLTKDIDIILGVGLEHLQVIKKIKKELRLKRISKQGDDFVEKTMVLPLYDNISGFRIDFIFSFTEYEKRAIKRAKSVLIGKKKIKFTSLEDIIIQKIFAGRPRDLEDVRNIMIKNPSFDKKYINKWLKEFDISNKGPSKS